MHKKDFLLSFCFFISFVVQAQIPGKPINRLVFKSDCGSYWSGTRPIVLEIVSGGSLRMYNPDYDTAIWNNLISISEKGSPQTISAAELQKTLLEESPAGYYVGGIGAADWEKLLKALYKVAPEDARGIPMRSFCFDCYENWKEVTIHFKDGTFFFLDLTSKRNLNIETVLKMYEEIAFRRGYRKSKTAFQLLPK